MSIDLHTVPASHAYIVASPDESLRNEAAALLARSFLCERGEREPCGVCTDRKSVV